MAEANVMLSLDALTFQTAPAALEQGASPDVALMKFCYIDVTAETDPDELFEKYRAQMEAIRRAHPGGPVRGRLAAAAAMMRGGLARRLLFLPPPQQGAPRKSPVALDIANSPIMGCFTAPSRASAPPQQE